MMKINSIHDNVINFSLDNLLRTQSLWNEKKFMNKENLLDFEIRTIKFWIRHSVFQLYLYEFEF